MLWTACSDRTRYAYIRDDDRGPAYASTHLVHTEYTDRGWRWMMLERDGSGWAKLGTVETLLIAKALANYMGTPAARRLAMAIKG